MRDFSDALAHLKDVADDIDDGVLSSAVLSVEAKSRVFADPIAAITAAYARGFHDGTRQTANGIIAHTRTFLMPAAPATETLHE